MKIYGLTFKCFTFVYSNYSAIYVFFSRFDLGYLDQHLNSQEIPQATQEEDFPAVHYNLESYLGQGQIAPPEQYPVPDTTGAEDEENVTFVSYGLRSVEEKKESLAVARNSLDILSSILSSDAEPKLLEVLFLKFSAILVFYCDFSCMIYVLTAHSDYLVSSDIVYVISLHLIPYPRCLCGADFSS